MPPATTGQSSTEKRATRLAPPPTWKNSLSDYERVLGPDDPTTLIARRDLAFWRGIAKDFAGQATAHASLLTDFLRVYGPNHPETFETRNYLAAYRAVRGDPTGAITDLANLHEDCRRVLGANHLITQAVQEQLTFWHRRTGALRTLPPDKAVDH